MQTHLWKRCAIGMLIASLMQLPNERAAQAQESLTNQTWSFMPQKSYGMQIDFQTLGGRQFWGDVKFFQGYRIQQNVFTKHYRLLDSNDVRRMWGSLEECEAQLRQIAVEKNLKPMSGKAVVLIHRNRPFLKNDESHGARDGERRVHRRQFRISQHTRHNE